MDTKTIKRLAAMTPTELATLHATGARIYCVTMERPNLSARFGCTVDTLREASEMNMIAAIYEFKARHPSSFVAARSNAPAYRFLDGVGTPQKDSLHVATAAHSRLNGEGSTGHRWKLTDLADHATLREVFAMIDHGFAKLLPPLSVLSPVRVMVIF